jgi:hypothetical protein
MISTPSRFVGENVNADTRKSFISGRRRLVILLSGVASSGVVLEVRTEIANVCQQVADKCGEPPLGDDA